MVQERLRNNEEAIADFDTAIKDYDEAIKLHPESINKEFPCFLIKKVKENKLDKKKPNIINIFLKLYFTIDYLKRIHCAIKGVKMYHYTSTDTLKKLIKSDEKLRLYSSVGMNDPNEGKCWLKWLEEEFKDEENKKIIQDIYENNSNTYILSFVDEAKKQEDNLIHWRSYGKSAGIDCNGVNLCFNKNDFNFDIKEDSRNKNDFNFDIKEDSRNKNDFNFVLMNVLYFTEDFQKNSENKEDLALIKETIEEICEKYVKENKDKDRETIKELLSICLDEIRFLIKDESYSSENEVRLIYRKYGYGNHIDDDIIKCDEKDIPRFYVELPKKIDPESITLGPKIEKKIQWEKYIEHYKSIIKVKKSEIKFN